MSIIFTGKFVSDCILQPDSHYWVNQLRLKTASWEGLCVDLHRLLVAINQVEDYLELTKTVWHEDFKDPKDSFKVHYMVKVQNSYVGTLVDAINALRAAGGETPWSWEFAPSLAKYLLDAGDHFRVLSNFAMLEMFLATGRIVTGIRSTISQREMQFFHSPFQNETGDKNRYWVAPLGPYTGVGGYHADHPIYYFGSNWWTAGELQHIKDTVLDTRFTAFEQLSDYKQITKPEIESYVSATDPTSFEPYTSGEIYNQNRFCVSALFLNVYRQDLPSDPERPLDPLETAYENLWHYNYVGADISDVSDGDLDLGDEIKTPVDINNRWGIFLGWGPHNYEHRYNYDDPSDTLRLIHTGNLEIEYDSVGLDTAPQYAEPGYLDLVNKFMPWNGQLFNMPLLNWEGWEHNEPVRDRFYWEQGLPEGEPYYWWIGEPSLQNPNGLNNNDKLLNDGPKIGGGDWRHSDEDPLLDPNTGLEPNWNDPELDRGEIMEAILDRLSGGSGASIYTGDSELKKYFWCWCESGIHIPQLAKSQAPQDWVEQALKLRFNFKIYNNPGFQTNHSAGSDEYVQRITSTNGAKVSSQGQIMASRTADMTFPSGHLIDGKWIVWENHGTNGYSPFEECVYRF